MIIHLELTRSRLSIGLCPAAVLCVDVLEPVPHIDTLRHIVFALVIKANVIRDVDVQMVSGSIVGRDRIIPGAVGVDILPTMEYGERVIGASFRIVMIIEVGVQNGTAFRHFGICNLPRNTAVLLDIRWWLHSKLTNISMAVHVREVRDAVHDVVFQGAIVCSRSMDGPMD